MQIPTHRQKYKATHTMHIRNSTSPEMLWEINITADLYSAYMHTSIQSHVLHSCTDVEWMQRTSGFITDEAHSARDHGEKCLRIDPYP